MANPFRGLFRRNTTGDNHVQSTHEEASFAHPYDIMGCNFINYLTGDAEHLSPYKFSQLMEMMKSPMDHIDELRKWTEWAYNSNGVVSTAIDTLTTLHSLDYIVVTKQKKNKVSRNERKKCMQKMHDALEMIRYKEVVRDALLKCANYGMYVAYVETRTGAAGTQKYAYTDLEIRDAFSINDRSVNISVIPLPIRYTRIIGRRNNCYEVAFDLRYFHRYTGKETALKRRLSGFPKQIQDGWERYSRGDLGDGAHWLRLDWKKTIVTKIKSKTEDPFGIPFALAALDDVDFRKYFIDTKRRVLDSVNNQIYYQTYPEGKDKGTSALTGPQQKAQHNVVRDALTQRKNANGVAFFSLAAGTKMDALPVDISLLDEENENAIKEDVNKDIGISAAGLSGSSSGNYATATLNFEMISAKVYTWIEAFVEELNKCLNYNYIRDGGYSVEMRILPVTFINRDKWVKNMSDLYVRGKGSLLAWVASCGMNTEEYLSLMEYELEEDFEKKFPVHKTSYTYSAADAAQENSIGEADGTNPSTASTIDNDGNSSPSPSD